MVGGAASAARVSVRANVRQPVLRYFLRRALFTFRPSPVFGALFLSLCSALFPYALTAEDPDPFYTGIQHHVIASSPWLGIFIILMGLFPLLIGWRLIRWTTALISCGITIGAVLFMAHDHWPAVLAWTMALSCGVFGGALGWFLYPLISAVQSAVLAATFTFVGMQMMAPTMPAWWYGLACGMGVTAAMIGWETAAISAIFYTVMIGYLGVLEGMVIICKPTTINELLLLAVVVGGIVIPIGALIQWRAHQRSLISE
jgi:hypothetical protein